MNLRPGFVALSVLLCIATTLAQSTVRLEKALVPATNPPPIQMLVPGFKVRELPLELNNINNLVYAPDGRLFALCYDGNVLQLKDTDSDGLEDAATPFYKNDKNEILPSIGMCWGPGGLYIASQGRVIRLRDKGDGTGEMETVTSGWVKPTGAAGSNLDSIGIAANKAGEIFFGLGCDNWHEAYRVNKDTGKSDYDIRSERGTIIKILPGGKREVICTGMRFPVGMAFNAAGDLFCTDQEGATWLPNGNPFDELLHIQKGRHYGFPPQHPKYLPAVTDEPSTFDYGPQHESTCGLHFNEGTKVFGPDWWRGDALVAGESRGKIWRTKLVKSATGYVAKTDLIACLTMLAIDAVPTPQGDLLVCCHSGSPDWGTGPQGKGKLFKISYANKEVAQPLFTYASSPTDTRIVFDRALRPDEIAQFTTKPTMAMGKYVTAGEQYESFRPGYQVVKNQKTMPRFEPAIHSVKASADGRALVVSSESHNEAVNYALTLGSGAAEMNILADLTGVQAEWESSNGKQHATNWLPHLDLKVAKELTTASAEHRAFFKTISAKGMLTLRGQLDLWHMLHPAVQPDAQLDYEYPAEQVTLVLATGARARIKLTTYNRMAGDGGREATISMQPKENRWLPYEITLSTGGGEPILEASWYTANDPRPRPFPLRRVLLPWAKPYLAVATANRTPELEGGDWESGRKIFFGDQATCSKCHQIGGEGGTIGANLSNLIYRDYASVLRDVTEPSAAINPDHLAYNVKLKDGDVQTGVILKNNNEEIVLGQVTGKELKIPKDKVESVKASTISLMPEGLLKGLSAQQQKDLLTFLLTTKTK